ncbi:hypothetical protein [Sphingobium cyanobacteriorum]|uniref:hypothetical protein n=1 Tax=Sphingobium cyanobacteriorum TaxID=3063954 RepID=UPI003CC690AF
MIAFDGGFLDGSVHPFHLTVGSWVLHPGQTMFDAVLVADPVEDVMADIFVVDVIGEPDVVAGRQRVSAERQDFAPSSRLTTVE